MKKIMILCGILVVLVWGITISVMAAPVKDETEAISREEYLTMEQEYLQEVKMMLLEKGCKNAGITLTYISQMDGNREYTLTINHSKLAKMKQKERALLEARIQECGCKIMLSEVEVKQL